MVPPRAQQGISSVHYPIQFNEKINSILQFEKDVVLTLVTGMLVCKTHCIAGCIYTGEHCCHVQIHQTIPVALQVLYCGLIYMTCNLMLVVVPAEAFSTRAPGRRRRRRHGCRKGGRSAHGARRRRTRRGSRCRGGSPPSPRTPTGRWRTPTKSCPHPRLNGSRAAERLDGRRQGDFLRQLRQRHESPLLVCHGCVRSGGGGGDGAASAAPRARAAVQAGEAVDVEERGEDNQDVGVDGECIWGLCSGDMANGDGDRTPPRPTFCHYTPRWWLHAWPPTPSLVAPVWRLHLGYAEGGWRTGARRGDGALALAYDGVVCELKER